MALRIDIDRSFQDDIDLADLIEQKTPTRFGKASGNGVRRTVKGACPWCGGEDRFAVFVNERPQRYICGIHKAQGCGKHGDPIQFIRDWENRTFREAVAILTGKDMPVVKPGSTKQTQAAAGGDWKSETWQNRAAQFSVDAEKRLWKDEGKDVLSYLLARGFTEETMKHAHLGMAPYKGSSIARDEPGPAPCLVVPWIDRKHSRYWRVELRDTRSGIAQNRRYESLPGSSVSDGLYGAQSFNRPIFLVEGAIDALSIAQEASDLVAIVATGSTGGSQHDRWLMRLANAPQVFVAFDAEKQAEQSASKWIHNLANATRWRTPIGKDANEMLMRGLSIRLWVEAALSTIETDQEETAIESPRTFASYDEFLSVVDHIGMKVFGEGCTITLLPKGYTHDQRIADLRDAGAFTDEGEQEWERAMWRKIREARARAGIPRWLIPGTEDWNEQVARSGLKDMRERRRAWFDQQKRLNDVVLAEEANRLPTPIIV